VRTVLLANNRLGAGAAAYLAERGDLAGIVLHPRDRQRHVDALHSLDVPLWEWPDGLDDVRRLRPACLLSVLFGYVLSAEWLDVPSWGAVNLHPALLPWNRGAAPNVWPLVDGSPAGTTLHLMVVELDAGPVIAQRQVATFAGDTALTLYNRLEAASLALLRDTWPDIEDVVPTPQAPGGTYHRLADLASLDLTEADFTTLDKLRARTFPPHGAEFVRDGDRFRVRVEIERLD
jgi:methionyl-tRNA formyltransferase